MTDELKLSAGFPTDDRAPQNVRWAEELGYASAFLFDTPFDGDDVWLRLHEAAKMTERIELGPGVLVPTSRHPLVNASNTVLLHREAPGRVTVGFGTGFSSRAALGLPAIRWAYMERYIRAFRALLRGESVEWEGSPIKLMLTRRFQHELPLEVPVLVSTLGPKGNAVAHAVEADGVIGMMQPSERLAEHDRALFAVMGTILDPGEKIADERVKDTIAPVWALNYHFTYTLQSPDAVLGLPGGREWLEAIERTPAEERHLSVHQGHFIEPNDADLAGWDAGGYAMLEGDAWTSSAADVGAAVRALAEAGVTEVQLQTTGSDVRRELEAFAAAVRDA